MSTSNDITTLSSAVTTASGSLAAITTAITSSTADTNTKTALTDIVTSLTDVVAALNDTVNVLNDLSASVNSNSASITTLQGLIVVAAPVSSASPYLAAEIPGRSSAASTQNNPLINFVTTSPLNAATHNSAYSFQLSATGGAGAGSYTYTAITQLPDGLSVSTSGLVSGTPVTPGIYQIVVTISDTAGNAVSGTFSLTIN